MRTFQVAVAKVQQLRIIHNIHGVCGESKALERGVCGESNALVFFF